MGKRIQLLLAVAAVSLVANTGLFWLFEHNVNPLVDNLFDAVWWWVVTSGTVGYGDIVPATNAGRVVAIVAILTGFFIYANFVALIAESAHAYLDRRNRGTAKVKARDHIVICEYTAIADELIQSLPDNEELRDHDVVIISGIVEQNPYREHSFVSGVPINPSVLMRASIEEASHVFVFANQRFSDPDVKTMHIASRVLKLNSKARVYVELVEPNSDLLAGASSRLVPLNSRELIRAVLRGEKINASVMGLNGETRA